MVNRMVKGVEILLQGHKVTIYQGEAALLDTQSVAVKNQAGSQTITAPRFILAIGSEPAFPPIPGLDLPGVVNSDEALKLEEVPDSIAIIGGGVIGMEMAAIFQGLGAKVTVLEMLPRILPPTDGRLASRFLALAKRRGMTIVTSARVTAVEPEGDKLKVKYKRGDEDKEVVVDKVLVATGRRPSSKGLNLETVGIRTERGAILVDDTMRTSIPNIFAVGDCVGGLLLAHKASYEGEIAAENALGGSRKADYSAIPYCIYTRPEIAGVGLTEEQAREKGVEYETASFPFSANARAWTIGEPEGEVRLIYERGSGRLLGAHIMGPWAGEMIGELALAVRSGLTVKDVAETVHPHPTLSEAVMEAAKAAAYGEAIHFRDLRRKAKGS